MLLTHARRVRIEKRHAATWRSGQRTKGGGSTWQNERSERQKSVSDQRGSVLADGGNARVEFGRGKRPWNAAGAFVSAPIKEPLSGPWVLLVTLRSATVQASPDGDRDRSRVGRNLAGRPPDSSRKGQRVCSDVSWVIEAVFAPSPTFTGTHPSSVSSAEARDAADCQPRQKPTSSLRRTHRGTLLRV